MNAIIEQVNFKEEDFSSKANVNFLNDVFDLVMKLETIETELLKDKKKMEEQFL